MRKLLKWLWGVLEVIIIVYVVFITSCILFRNKYGFTQFGKVTMITVNEENMKHLPEYKEGDLLLVKSQSNAINPGDLIYYYLTINEKYYVKTGAVVSKTEDDSSSLYVLNDADKTTVASPRVLGKYSNAYPSIGGILEFLEGRFGFLVFVLLPIMVVFIYQIYQLVIVVRYEKVDEDEENHPKKGSKKKTKNPTNEKEDSIEVL